MHNIKAFNVVWTGKHKKDVSFILKSGFEKYVNNNKCYVLLKRFSSKEEKRRLTAGISLPNCLSSKFVGFENHINFIGASGREFIEHEAFGLAALFNSTFVDKYFRCVSGNTQVNATEIELLRIPPQKEIIKIGELVSKIQNTSQTAIDEIISTVLGVGICN
jgi:adenine-specific DNA-methyltransferase